MTFDRWPQPETLRAAPDYTIGQLQAAMAEGQILTGQAVRCDAALNLHIRLGALSGIMPRGECVAPFLSGAQREIAVLSCVGRGVCCRVTGQRTAPNGDTELLLSRRLAQEEAMDYIEAHAEPGLVIPAQITHLAPFGAFADIGCGVVAMLPIEYISVSRISHPRDRFRPGPKILTAVRSVDRERRRFTMTHKELLGTWMENASWFSTGETVRGVVRSVKSYGTFIELAPNLSGLADAREDLRPGDGVSVYIKSIRPERMKIKLHVIERLPPAETPEPLRYQVTDGVLDRWVYSPAGYEKEPVETVFTAAGP